MKLGKKKSKTSRKTYVNFFLQSNTEIFLRKVLSLLHFGFYQICMRTANLIAETQLKLLHKRVLSIGEPCACEYVTLLQ